MNDRLRLKQLCNVILGLKPENPPQSALGESSLLALQRLARNKLDASQDGEVRPLRPYQVAMLQKMRAFIPPRAPPPKRRQVDYGFQTSNGPSLVEQLEAAFEDIERLNQRLAPSRHSEAQINAFKQGFQDRLDGKPICAFGDARDNDGDLTDSYCCGYDPLDELGLTLPEYREYSRLQVAQYLAETGIVIPKDMPRNPCEFPDEREFDPIVGAALLNLLNQISTTKPGFDAALEEVRILLNRKNGIPKAHPGH